MSLAGGSYLGLSESEEAAVPGSKTDLPCTAMPNILGQCYTQKNQNCSSQKWPTTGGKTQLTNTKKDGNGFDENDNNKLPEPSVVLYKKKLDFTLPQNKTIGCGLINIGNTCFINSTLQCLLYLPPWYNYVTKEHQQNCKLSSIDCVVCMFHRFIKGAFNYHGSSFAPREIVDKLKYFCANMVRGKQEDAHEFLVSFVDRMQMSLLKGVPKLVDPNSEYTTAVHQVFGNVVRSQVRCKACGWRSNNYEFGLNLILGIKNIRSLITAFKVYTKKELMDGANAYNCERCRQQQPAEKHLSVHKAPNVLIIQLKRYDQNEYGNIKLTQHVDFNESLDLGPFMSETETQLNHMYLLHGVLVHAGVSIHSGHYYAYVRGMDRKWYRMNDERVHEVSLEEVTSTQAYILFYIRKVKESQPKPPASSPVQVNRKPGISPTTAANISFVNHKPVVTQLNSNGKTKPKSELSGLNKLVNVNGGMSKLIANGAGDAVTASNNASCTSFGASSVLNGGIKELSLNPREKVTFKISRAKDRWNTTGCNGSKSSAPAAESKVPVALSCVSNLPLVPGNTTKLVAYDDESSDQESNCMEAACDVAEVEKLVVDASSSQVDDEAEIAPTKTNKTLSGSQIPMALDLEMTVSKFTTTEKKPGLKRSSSDSNIGAHFSSVSDALNFSRNFDRRLSSGDGPLEHSSDKPDFAKKLEFHTKSLHHEHNVADNVTSPAIDSNDYRQNSLQISDESAPANPSETILRLGGLNCVDTGPDNGNTLPEVDIQRSPELTDVAEATVMAQRIVTESDPTTCRSKKRHRSGKDHSSSHRRSHVSGDGSNLDDRVDYVWVEKTFESILQDGSGGSSNGMLSQQDEAAKNPDYSREKHSKRSKVLDYDQRSKHRSRSVESQQHRKDHSSRSTSRQPAEHCSTDYRSHPVHQERNGHIHDQVLEQVRSKSSHQLSKQNGRRHRSGSSDQSFDQNIRRHGSRSSQQSIKRDDRRHRSRSSHQSIKRDDRRHRSRSSHRSIKRDDARHRSRSSHRSIKRDDTRHRSRSSHRSIKQDDRRHGSSSSRRSSKQDDRRHRSRSSHRSIKRDDSRHRSRSSQRSVTRDSGRHGSRSPHKSYSSYRDRKRSRSSLSRRNCDVQSSKSYDYHIYGHNRGHRIESSH